ncbi:MAG TPA: hypothetical protein VFV23_13460 [Verrucomicrobiae bacterium]|nr:hypothetical protein [Verrucomicrobiae bacterium]
MPATKIEYTNKIKIMGKQYNKVLKRKRRASYLKRKKVAVKAKRKTAAPAAA